MFAMMGLWVMSLLGVHLPGLLSGGPIGMGFCLLSAGLASSNLLLVRVHVMLHIWQVQKLVNSPVQTLRAPRERARLVREAVCAAWVLW